MAHPVVHYILLLQEGNESQIIALEPSTEPAFSVNTSNYIKENSKYTYRVRAVNNISASSEIMGRDFCKFSNIE